MKYSFLFIYSFSILISFSQTEDMTLIDNTSKWFLKEQGYSSSEPECDLTIISNDITYYIDGDSTISGKTYFKVYKEKVNNYSCSEIVYTWSDSTVIFHSLIREENKIFYKYDDINEDYLFKDYNYNIGDTIGSYCIIESIDTLFLYHQSFLKYNFDCISLFGGGCTSFQIQAIGTRENSLFENFSCALGDDPMVTISNYCYSKNDFVIKVNPNSECVSTGDTSLYTETPVEPIDTIDTIHSSINEIGQLKPLVYPNPSGKYINIEFNNKISGSLNLYSVLGELIYNEEILNSKKLIINISEFNKGIYYLSIKPNLGLKYTEKIVHL